MIRRNKLRITAVYKKDKSTSVIRASREKFHLFALSGYIPGHIQEMRSTRDKPPPARLVPVPIDVLSAAARGTRTRSDVKERLYYPPAFFSFRSCAGEFCGECVRSSTEYIVRVLIGSVWFQVQPASSCTFSIHSDVDRSSATLNLLKSSRLSTFMRVLR